MATTPHGDPNVWDPVDLLDRTWTAGATAAWAVFDAALAKVGFGQSFFAFGVPMTSKQPLLDKFKRGIFGGGRFVNDLFPELVKRPDLLATEPVAPHCKRSLTPFVWTCDELVAGERSGLSLARDFDLAAFMVFPLRNDDATYYGNFTVFCADGCQKSWLEHAQRFAPLLHVTAQYLHDTLAGLDEAPADPPRLALSPRQRECLLWASLGLSTKQIAARLKLSEPVIHEYLGAAKRKLGCATRAHAVARAVKLGLIKP
jgi:DNA-binding CsgD family transcriptional regulator